MRGAVQVSVVIPLYNKANYVLGAITSALEQVPSPLEIVVVDDGSTDEGASIVKAIGDERIRYVYQANAGVSAARNLGIALSRGDAVAFLDADDVLLPGYLAAIQALATAHPEAAMWATGYVSVWPDGRRSSRILNLARGQRSGVVENFHFQWSKCSFTFTSAITVPKRALRALAIWFPEGERLGEDQDLWFRLAEHGPVAYWAEALVDYRLGVAQSATSNASVDSVLPCYRRLGERLDTGRVPSPLISGARRVLASHWLNIARSHMTGGRMVLAKSFVDHPHARGNFLYWMRMQFLFAFMSLRQRSSK